MSSPQKSVEGTPRSKKIDYMPLEVDVKVVEKLRVSNQVINNEAENGLNFNRRWKMLRKVCTKILNNPVIAATMGMLSLFSLYAADIAILLNGDENVYDAFETALSFAFFIFLFEIVLTSISNPNYFLWPNNLEREEGESLIQSLKRRLRIGSFYFYLELFGTMTILIDMTWAVGEPTEYSNSGIQVADRGGKAARIVRLMRIMRFFKYDRYVHKVFATISEALFNISSSKTTEAQSAAVDTDGDLKKSSVVSFDLGGEEHKDEDDVETGKKDKKKKRKKKKGGDADSGSESEDEAGSDHEAAATKKGGAVDEVSKTFDETPPASLVGATMTDLTHMRIIIVVLTMLVVIPLLTVDDPDTSCEVSSSFIHVTAYNAYTTSAPRSPSLVYNILNVIGMQSVEYLSSSVMNEKSKIPIMAVELSPSITTSDNAVFSGWTNDTYTGEYIRTCDKIVVEKVTDSFTTTVTFDNRSEVMDQAQQCCYTTSFVLFVLFFGTYFFTQTVNKLVIDPIETMVALVTKISENPLGVDYDKDYGAKEGFLEGMETTILLNTINKIGGLMRVGFGEAGASIIADNLKNSLGARLNLMTAGRMIHSIFGFCDVRQFTDTTECLQEEVMLFVNRIAHILHSIVNQCSGSANKNIGDAFLLTWKLEDEMTQEETANLADQALLTFCKALVELGRYQDFICNFSNAANERLYKRFPGYLVRIGSGLHVGWAIEGAIGSNRKIDASYLSPHVNFTEYLESSTKAYGVPLLISEPFFVLLSEDVNVFVRKVDRVRTNPAEDPVSLYTYDSDLALKWPKKEVKKSARRSTMSRSDQLKRRQSSMHEKKAKELEKAEEESRAKGKRRQSMHSQLKEEKSSGDQQTLEDLEAGEDKGEDLPEITVRPYQPDVWERDNELILLRHMVYDDPKFRPLWDTAIEAYLAGDWPTAHHILNDCLEISNKKCGPSKFLLKEIEANNGIAPDDWSGYRIDF